MPRRPCGASSATSRAATPRPARSASTGATWRSSSRSSMRAAWPGPRPTAPRCGPTSARSRSAASPASTVGGRLAAIRSLYRHAARQGWIATDPVAGVRSPKRPGRLPRVLSVAGAARLVEAPATMTLHPRRPRDPALADAAARRDAALLELLYATGMRISELSSLTMDRLDLGRRRLRVIGKGDKERELLFGEHAARAVRAYLASGRPALAARASRSDARSSSSTATGGPLTARGARMVVDRWVTASGAPATHLAPHPAPLVRHAPAGGRRGPAHGPGAARPRQPGHHPDLHPPLGRLAAHRLPLRAPTIGPGRLRPPDAVSEALGGETPPAAAGPSVAGPSVGRVLANASLILTVAALASRLLGWIRLLVIGSQFGATADLDAYFAAFRIPDAIFQLVVAGALSAALIPVFSSYRAREDEKEAWRLASSVINLVLVALAVFSAIMAILAPWVVPIIAPGFDGPTTETDDPPDPPDAAQPRLRGDGRGGERPAQQLRALRRAGPGAARLQPGHHRGRGRAGPDRSASRGWRSASSSARSCTSPSSCRSCARWGRATT